MFTPVWGCFQVLMLVILFFFYMRRLFSWLRCLLSPSKNMFTFLFNKMFVFFFNKIISSLYPPPVFTFAVLAPRWDWPSCPGLHLQPCQPFRSRSGARQACIGRRTLVSGSVAWEALFGRLQAPSAPRFLSWAQWNILCRSKFLVVMQRLL